MDELKELHGEWRDGHMLKKKDVKFLLKTNLPKCPLCRHKTKLHDDKMGTIQVWCTNKGCDFKAEADYDHSDPKAFDRIKAVAKKAFKTEKDYLEWMDKE